MKLGKQLFRGEFTKVYAHPEKDGYYILKSVDDVKEAISFINSDNPHIPKITRIKAAYDISRNGNTVSLYEIPIYKKVLKKDVKPEQWASYRYLKDNLHLFINYDYIEEMPIDKGIKNGLQKIYFYFRNYVSHESNVAFDNLSQSNYAVDNDGNLVLLDLFFNKDKNKRMDVF